MASPEAVGTAKRMPLLHRWGLLVARRRRLVIAISVVVLAGCALAFPVLQSRLTAMDFTVTGSESARVDELLQEQFPELGAEQNVIVVESTAGSINSPESRSAVDSVVSAAERVDGVTGVIRPFPGGPPMQVAPNGSAAIVVVGLEGPMADRAVVARHLQEAVEDVDAPGIEVNVTGYSPVQNDLMEIENADVARAESFGLPVAMIVLVLALGALVAGFLPVGIALVGVLLAAGAMFTLSHVTDFDSLTMAVATMIGIGVGIDYAMFIVSRFREELAVLGVTTREQREEIAEAVARSSSTAGKTIIASGIIVMISLCALVIINSPIFRGIAIGVATAVTAMLIVGVTLLPAVLAELGPAVNRGGIPKRFQPTEISANSDVMQGRWARWARTVMARPVVFGVASVAILVFAAAPIFGMRYGVDMGMSALDDKPSGRAATALAANFSSGAIAPIEVIAIGQNDAAMTDEERARLTVFLNTMARDSRVEAVLPAEFSEGYASAAAIPAVPFDSEAAIGLVNDLRTAAERAGAQGPEILIGGSTAEFVDLDEEMTAKLPLVIAFVLAVSLAFLIVVFRSIALPIKAILMNLLATGAALGITVAVFQWGIGESVLGFTSPGFVQTFLPTLVFAVLFGLSMDYEVFLIRRMREFWETTEDNEYAVAAGIAHTARPITAAAAIMVIVFGSFVTADVLELKQIGFSLAIAVAIDALLVRLVLVPAFMKLFGKWNWWLPAFRKSRDTAPAG
ncbi:MMPL family transporter [Aldersonia kunmingensis]|uniref:MMPL family transporter n=1 Tax=Aldersonia kunmingensis TaxID=408066 RepID=UPI000A675706|nr:MMPL family transporter [Aldersonia kunmingensis]